MSMKRQDSKLIRGVLCSLFWLFTNLAYSQVGIGTNTPNTKSALEISDNTRGFLPPRMTTAQRTTLGGTLAASDEGMLVYDIGVDSLYVWRGTAWRALASTAPAAAEVANGTAANQTLRWNGSAWAASSFILNDESRVGIGAIGTNARFNVQQLLATGTPVGYGLEMTTATPTTLINGGTWDVSATSAAQSSQVRGLVINASNEATIGSPSVRGVQVTASGASNGNKYAFQGEVTGGGSQIGTLLSLTAAVGATSQKGVQASMTTSGLNINQTGFEANLNNVTTGTKVGYQSTVSGVVGTGTAAAFFATLSGNTTPFAWAFVASGGGINMNPNLVNSNPRPNLSTSILPGEIRGTSNSGATANDGFLRLSAGGGTSVAQQAGIDISGGNSNGDLNNTILMYTGGTERIRLNGAGEMYSPLLIPNAPTLTSFIIPSTSVTASQAGSSTWTPNGNGHTYVLYTVPTPISWQQAMEGARRIGGYLPTITSAAEQSHVANFLTALSYSTSIPLGHTDINQEGIFQTITGEQGFEVVGGIAQTYTNFAGGEPNNATGIACGASDGEDFLEMGPAPGRNWNDVQFCAATYLGFVVEFSYNTRP